MDLLDPDLAEKFNALDEVFQLELATRHHALFLIYVWPEIVPAPLVMNWHIVLMCMELQAVVREDSPHRELALSVPPRGLKSTSASVTLPAHTWLEWPECQWMCISNDDSLAHRDAMAMRQLVGSERYQKLQEHVRVTRGIEPFRLSDDQNAKGYFRNTAGGHRISQSIRTTVTGKNADIILLDDLLDAKEAVLGTHEQQRRVMLDINRIKSDVLWTRFNSFHRGRFILIMQRLHDLDPAGVMISEGAHSVVFQARLEKDLNPKFGKRHPLDPRTEEGELLFPARIPAEMLDTMRERNPSLYASQFQQRPSPASGVLYAPGAFDHRYKGNPWDQELDTVAQGVDTSFKVAVGSDRQVIATVGRRKGRFYVLDIDAKRVDYRDARQAILRSRAKWPRVRASVIEESANGYALLSDLQATLPGVIGWRARDSKMSRAQVVARYWNDGQILLPEDAPWLTDLLDEHLSFPYGSHDDIVDAINIVILWLLENSAWGVDPMDEFKWLEHVEFA